MMIARWIPTGVTTHAGHRAFVVGATRPLQKFFEGESKSEKETDTETSEGELKSEKEAETVEKALEAAESLKDGAKQVKETCALVRDTVEKTSNTVTKATNAVAQKVTHVTEVMQEKLDQPMEGMLTSTWGKATKRFEDKVVDKITDRILSKEAQERIRDKTKKE